MSSLSDRARFPEGEVHWENPNLASPEEETRQICETVILKIPSFSKKEMKKLRRIKDWEEASEKSPPIILGPRREGR